MALRREVEDRIGLEVGECAVHGGLVADVGLEKREARIRRFERRGVEADLLERLGDARVGQLVHDENAGLRLLQKKPR